MRTEKNGLPFLVRHPQITELRNRKSGVPPEPKLTVPALRPLLEAVGGVYVAAWKLTRTVGVAADQPMTASCQRPASSTCMRRDLSDRGGR